MANGLVPDIGAQFGRGAQVVGSLQQQQLLRQQAAAQAAQQAQLQGLLGRINPAQQAGAPQLAAGVQGPADPLQAGGVVAPAANQQQALAQLAVDFPERFEAVNKGLGLITQHQKDEAADFAFDLRGTPADQRPGKIRDRVRTLRSQGRNPSDTASLESLDEAQQNEALDIAQLAALSPEKRLEIAEGRTPSPFKQAELDIKQGTLEVRQEEQRQRTLDREINRETNSIKRLELEEKLGESKRKSGEAKRAIEFEAENAVGAVDASVATIDRLLTGEGLEAAAGISSVFPTVPGSKAADFEAQLETLQSQAFLAQVEKMKGLGALSENEGKKLGAAIGSLSLSMSDASFRKELDRIKGTLNTAKQRLNKKFNIVTAGSAAELSDEDLAAQLGL